MNRTQPVPFAEWTPDRPEDAGGATIVRGAIPAEGAYRPLPNLSASTDTLSATCAGAYSTISLDGSATVFAASKADLYMRTQAGLVNASGGTYNCPSDSYWSFTRYGDRILTTNVTDGVQFYDLPASGGGAGTFAALAGSPPRAQHVARLRDFVVLGGLYGDTALGDAPHAIRWSGFNDSEFWETNRARQSDFNEMPREYGAVTGVVGEQFGTVFQERAIHRMTFVGGAKVFALDTLEEERGCIAPWSIVNFGWMTWFLSEDGFYVWDGQTARNISDQRISRWFEANSSYAMRRFTVGAIDWINKLVVWAFPSGYAGTAILDRLLIYSWVENRWTYDSFEGEELQYLISAPQKGYTLEELDAFGTVETLPFSMDSRIWAGGQFRLAAFDSSSRYAEFTGTNRAAVLETQDWVSGSARRAFVSEIWPLLDWSSGAVTAQAMTRAQRPGDAMSVSASVTVNLTGYAGVRASGRYHRARLNIPAASVWTHAQGVELTYRQEGRR